MAQNTPGTPSDFQDIYNNTNNNGNGNADNGRRREQPWDDPLYEEADNSDYKAAQHSTGRQTKRRTDPDLRRGSDDGMLMEQNDNAYVYQKQIQRNSKIERVINKLVDKVVGYEVQNKTSKFYTLQSLMEKVARYNPQFYIGIMHPYLTSIPSALNNLKTKIASLAGWTNGAMDVRADTLNLYAVKQIADDLVLVMVSSNSLK